MRTIPLKFKLPDDARQLCGYDITGDEVYEGDKVWRVFRVHEAAPDKITVDTDDYHPAYQMQVMPSTIADLHEFGFRDHILQSGKTSEVRRYIHDIKKGKPVYGSYLYVEGDNIGEIP